MLFIKKEKAVSAVEKTDKLGVKILGAIFFPPLALVVFVAGVGRALSPTNLKNAMADVSNDWIKALTTDDVAK